MKKILDERQQLLLYHIGYRFFWVFFWGLLADILIKSCFMRLPARYWGLEWLLFMAASIGSVVCTARAGIYDTRTKPGLRSYLFYAGVSAPLFATFYTIVNAYQYDQPLAGLLLTWAILAAVLFALVFAALALTGYFVKKRQKKLEKAFSDDEDDGTE